MPDRRVVGRTLPQGGVRFDLPEIIKMIVFT
jgi:hypothetical protein